MEQIHDLNRIRKMIFADPTNPYSAIPQKNNLLSPSHTSTHSLGINPFAKFLCRLDGSYIGGGTLVTDGKTFLIELGLSKDESQFGFPSLGDACLLALAPFGLGWNNRNASPVNGNVELGNRLKKRNHLALHRQVTFPMGDHLNLRAHRLGNTSHLFTCHSHSRHLFQIPSPFLKRLLGSHTRHHSANPGRKRRVLNIQILVFWNHTFLTVRTMIIGTLDLNLGKNRCDPLYPIIRKLSLVP